MVLLLTLNYCIAASDEVLRPKNGRNNWGSSLEFSDDPRSTFLGLFFNPAPEDSITNSNENLLRSNIRGLSGYEDSTRWIKVGRRFKLIDTESCFVSIYDPDWTYDMGNAIFVLNDLKGNERYILNNFQIEDFNKLIRTRSFVSTINYYSLTELYVILNNIEENIFFINYKGELYVDYLGYYLSVDRKEEKAIIKFDASMEAPSIRVDSSSVVVTMFAYYPSLMQINKIVCNFTDGEIKDVNINKVASLIEILHLKQKVRE
jgi:hypothetical protein